MPGGRAWDRSRNGGPPLRLSRHFGSFCSLLVLLFAHMLINSKDPLLQLCQWTDVLVADGKHILDLLAGPLMVLLPQVHVRVASEHGKVVKPAWYLTTVPFPCVSWAIARCVSASCVRPMKRASTMLTKSCQVGKGSLPFC
jgi:hypothetical protein